MTIVSLLLALMLPSGIWLWYPKETAPCARYLAGDRTAPASQRVVSGTRIVTVPCSDWFAWQPMEVQVFCLAELVLAVVFVLAALGDTREWLRMRRRRHPIR